MELSYQKPLKNMVPITPEEREKMLYAWNDTQHDYPRQSTLHELISLQAQHAPKNIAVTYENESLTYDELDQRSNQLAHYLISLGVGVESLVGLYINRSLDMITGILGILKAGGAYVPIDADLPTARIQMMMEDAQPAVLLTQENLLPNLDGEPYAAVCLDRDWLLISQEVSDPPDVGMDSDNLAYVIYTSGSTGKPKGAKNVHRSVVNLVNSMGRRIGITSTDHILSTTTLSFDPSVWEIFLPLTTGAQLTIATREAMLDGAKLQRIIDDNGITFLRSTPSGWRLYLETGWQGGKDLIVLSGGEALTPDLAHKLQQRSAVLWHTYGPAEAAVVCTMGIIPPEAKVITIGRPHDNIQIYLLDEHLEPVPVGATGELYIGGDGVGRGYYNRPELTAEKFIPNPFVDNDASGHPLMYRTGDLARFLPDGQIVFVGRNDLQVKIRGNRIELGDVEAAIRRHPAIAQNLVLTHQDTPGDLYLVAYLIPEHGLKIPDGRELRQFLRRTLPDYMLPSRFVVMERFPVSPNGKIDRQALPAPNPRSEELIGKYVPPRTDLEAEMSALFAEVLNLDRVSIHDSFFDLGGNSLLAARLLYRAEDIFRTKIPIREFLARSDVSGFSQVVADQQRHENLDRGNGRADKLPKERGKPIDAHASTSQLLQQSNLTQTQFLMWMGQQMNPDAPLYNVVHAFTIHGLLDVSAFRSAFQALIDHNDAFRTIFRAVNGVPRQEVLENVSTIVELIDFSHQPNPEAAYQAFLGERKVRLLPLDRPQFDVVLVKLASDRFVWYLCQHHIMTDAVSAELIFERMAYYYQLALEDRLGDIPEPPQYRDFIEDEREFRQTSEYQRVLTYWRDKYGIALPPTEFYGRTSTDASLHTERVVYDLGAQRSAMLREIARGEGFASPSKDMSLFTVFATLLFVTIHRLNGRQRLRLGTPFHGRPTVSSLDIIGLFIEMGIMQVDIEKGETFVSLGDKVMAETLDGLGHVQPGMSSADTNRAYDVILNFIQANFNEFAGLPVSKKPIHTGYIDADHNLRLQIVDYDASGNFILLFDMKTDLFGATERGWLVDHFLRVVDAFIEKPSRPIGDFTLLSEAEQQQLLVEFNATDAAYPSGETVVKLFEEQVERTPDKLAAVEGEATVTYAALNERANRLAHFLQTQGIRSETAVAICMDRSIDVLVAIWGVLKAGGAYIPIDAAYPSERIAFMLEDAEPALVFTDGELSLPQTSSVKAVNLAKLDLTPFPSFNPPAQALPDNLIYMIYTSGSTGAPKGTMLTHQGLLNYVWWARSTYQTDNEPLDFPLYSSLAFDLTVTSIFVPLLSGGKVLVYGISAETPGLEILSVFGDDAVDIVKLTPAHLEVVRKLNLSNSRIRKLIVGGEDFKTDLARSILDLFMGRVDIYNEYGPTEAVVGCMIHRYVPVQDTGVSIPIGTPAANARIYVLDDYDQPVPPGVVGEMVISSDGVARGYHNRPELTAQKFGPDPFRQDARIYRTGDIACWNENGQMVFLGRRDHQVKIGGARIELGEIETVLRSHPSVQEAVVSVVQFDRYAREGEIGHCITCGLPSNYPSITFNEEGVCSLCSDFDTFRDDVFHYFKTNHDLQAIIARAKEERIGDYDCMLLYSGGKDSTYVLSQLVEMGLKVLAFSLDNGYISVEAIENIRRVTEHLGVDLVLSKTPHMNAIFADSLERYSNVCQGCYKAIYTLSMKVAREKGIKYIFTGLSRGQLFETRLDELYRNRIFDVAKMDEAVLNARKIYHGVDDAVYRLLDVSMFGDERVFDDIQFIDYFRYTDVELEDIYDFLSTRVPWIRPQDTGRSTNCLINEAGIYVHQTERGYHNYALPYSWDVRLGHKTREEALEELDDELRMPMIRQMLDEVGYKVKEWHANQSERRLAAYFVANDETLTITQLRDYLSERLPAYMVPAYLVRLEAMPLTPNGKINRQGLPNPTERRPEIDAAFVAPRSSVEMALADIWSKALNVERVGIYDDFFDLGGASIPAIQVIAKVSDQYEVDFPVRSFFEHPTIAQQSEILEEILLAQLEAMSDEEVERLLAAMDE